MIAHVNLLSDVNKNLEESIPDLIVHTTYFTLHMKLFTMFDQIDIEDCVK